MAKRVRTPRLIQMESVECGAASLGIILGYYGRFVPLVNLRDECFVTRDGSNALYLLSVAQKYGLAGQGLHKSFEELKSIDCPAILFWEFTHFLVLEGFGKNKVYLNDPNVGHKTISFQEFQKSYSGVVLVFSKTAEFRKEGEKTVLWRQIQKRLSAVSASLGFLSLLSLCLLLPGFALPAFLIIFITLFSPGHLLASPPIFLVALFGTALFTGALTLFRLHFASRLNALLSTRLTSQFFWHMLHLPINFFDLRHSGEVAYRIALNESAIESITEVLISSLIDLLLVIFFGILLFAFDTLIATIGISLGIMNLIFLACSFHLRLNAYARLQQDFMKYTAESISALQAIDAIKSHAAENTFFSKWAAVFSKTLAAIQDIGKKDTILATAPLSFQFLSTAMLLTVGSFRIMDGQLSIGALMGLQLLLTNFLLPINRFVGLGQVLQNLQVDFARIDDIVEHPVDRIYCSHPPPTDQVKLLGNLEFRHVSFGYSRANPPLIDDLSFTISAGRRLALVGALGSGKSTIAKLALGLYEPWRGEILYDGKPLEAYPLDLIQRSIATVDQQIFLFAGTIRENLTLWNIHMPQEILLRSTKDARIHDAIMHRPGGYDNLLTEGGGNLSGGERQRIEIARALLYSPSLLILDEATSALDSQIELEITEQILRRGCSLLIIAHRLSTIRHCDEILVLDRGHLAQKGTHEELKNRAGIYQSLIQDEQ